MDLYEVGYLKRLRTQIFTICIVELSKIAQKKFLNQPNLISSANCRINPHLKAIFVLLQECAFYNYLETSLMIAKG